jgi:hypothetical protein
VDFSTLNWIKMVSREVKFKSPVTKETGVRTEPKKACSKMEKRMPNPVHWKTNKELSDILKRFKKDGR